MTKLANTSMCNELREISDEYELRVARGRHANLERASKLIRRLVRASL